MGAKNTVLIVDDNVLVLDSIDLLLSMTDGFQTIRALGSAGAASHMQNAQTIDVIVADVILAGTMTGIDICEKAIAQYPAIAVVVITADTETHRADIPERGVFMRKPFSGERLIEAIGEAMRRVGEVSTQGK